MLSSSRTLTRLSLSVSRQHNGAKLLAASQLRTRLEERSLHTPQVPTKVTG